MYFIIYETINKISNKRYRGAHITNDLNDNYLGSGILLKKAIAKYGIENFERKILCECDSIESMFIKEAEYVNCTWVEDPNTYNLKIGGEGGWDYINKTRLRWNEQRKKLHSIEMKNKRECGEWGPKQPTYGFKGKKHSLESKKKISQNNTLTLSDDEIQKRICNWNSLPDKRGKITKISSMWNVSHTQVRRFMNKYLRFA